MIYLGYNRDLNSVAHFWRDRLHDYLFDKKVGKQRPFLKTGKHNRYYDNVFAKWKGHVEREARYRRISIGTRDELLSKLNEFERNFDEIVLAPKDGLEKLSKERYSKETQNILSDIFETLYNGFTKVIANDVLEKLKIRTCPYCNRNYTFTVKSSCSKDGKTFTTRPEFDHFYNKSLHPLLALSFYNLVPSCPICNHGKATDYIGVNPYFEGFQSKFGIYDVDKKNETPLNINEIKLVKSEADFSIGFVNPSTSEQQNIEELGLDVLYNKYKDYVMDLIEKSTSYGTLVQNQAFVDSFQGIFRTPQEVFEFIWGKYLNEEALENRPLSKLTRDILEQLDII